MKNEKITKKEYFEMIKGLCGDNEDIVKFCNHEIDLLNQKKSKGGNSKMQKVNEGITNLLINEMSKLNKGVTISELLTLDTIKNFTYQEGNETKYLTNQKISSLLNKLVETKEVVKVTDKRKSYFSLSD